MIKTARVGNSPEIRRYEPGPYPGVAGHERGGWRAATGVSLNCVEKKRLREIEKKKKIEWLNKGVDGRV